MTRKERLTTFTRVNSIQQSCDRVETKKDGAGDLEELNLWREKSRLSHYKKVGP